MTKHYDPDLDFDNKNAAQSTSTSEKETETKQKATPAGSIANPSREEFEQQLNAAEAKANQYYDELLRLKAESENYRKRSEREISQTIKYSVEKFAKELLPVVDNLERALEQKDKENAAAWTGVEMTLKLLMSSLEKFGVQAVHPLDQPFDPHLHEAMSTQNHAEKAPNTVLTVLQKGYLLHDRLLRPALVIVSKNEAPGG